MQHHAGEILAPFGLLLAFIGLAQYNQAVGAVTGTLVLLFTAFKLYNEIKKTKDLNKDSNSSRPAKNL